jgi:hypothetical protein
MQPLRHETADRIGERRAQDSHTSRLNLDARSFDSKEIAPPKRDTYRHLEEGEVLPREQADGDPLNCECQAGWTGT